MTCQEMHLLMSSNFSFQASEVRDIPDEKSSWPPIFRDNKIITYHSIRPWYSPSGSFIRSIQPKLLTQPLQCGKKYSFSFDYTNPDKLENIDFIYLVIIFYILIYLLLK